MVAMTTVKLFVITCFLSAKFTTITGDQRAATFKAMTSSTGEVLCAVDKPTEVEWLKGGSQIRCGAKCIDSKKCFLAYNFNKLNGKCDKYSFTPYNYTTVQGCSGYIKEDRDRILVQQNLDGSTFFQKTWAAYKAGFGDLCDNYWLGNDQLHNLTATGLYKMRFDLQYVKDGKWRYAEYSNFAVADEANKYRLTYTGYSGNATNGLVGESGAAFSTKDQDNDANTGSCAAVGSYGNGGGFWYSGPCGKSFINSPKIGNIWGFAWDNPAVGTTWPDLKLITSRMTLIRK